GSVLGPGWPERSVGFARFDEVRESDEGWSKYNRHYWLRDYESFATYFFDELFSEPHSTKQKEDSVGWALETSPEVLLATEEAPTVDDSLAESWMRGLTCPVLVIHGSADRCQPVWRGEQLAELTGG